MNWQAQWIRPAADMESRAPLFKKTFRADKPLTSAVLRITGLGVYEAAINGQRVSEDVLAPGWTAYKHRLQVQTYADALSRIYEMPVKRKMLYFFSLDTFYEL